MNFMHEYLLCMVNRVCHACVCLNRINDIEKVGCRRKTVGQDRAHRVFTSFVIAAVNVAVRKARCRTVQDGKFLEP